MSSRIQTRREGLQELAEIEEIPVGSKAPPLPWRAVATSPPIWGIIFTDAANTFGLYHFKGCTSEEEQTIILSSSILLLFFY